MGRGKVHPGQLAVPSQVHLLYINKQPFRLTSMSLVSFYGVSDQPYVDQTPLWDQTRPKGENEPCTLRYLESKLQPDQDIRYIFFFLQTQKFWQIPQLKHSTSALSKRWNPGIYGSMEYVSNQRWVMFTHVEAPVKFSLIFKGDCFFTRNSMDFFYEDNTRPYFEQITDKSACGSLTSLPYRSVTC